MHSILFFKSVLHQETNFINSALLSLFKQSNSNMWHSSIFVGVSIPFCFLGVGIGIHALALSSCSQKSNVNHRSEVAQSCLTLCDPMDSSLHQAPLSMGFSRQEYWNGLPFPSPGNLPNPGNEPRSLTL